MDHRLNVKGETIESLEKNIISGNLLHLGLEKKFLT